MLDNQMFELLDKLKKVNYETIDIDDFLDQRECDPFDSEWVRVYQTDDFGLIADSIMLHYSDEWLEKVISCYKEAIIPCGKL